METSQVIAPSPASSSGSCEPARDQAEAMAANHLSLADLFRAEEAPLVRFAFGFVGRREVAEEVVQEAFLRLHRHREEVENPKAWIYRAVRNLSLNHLRKHRREEVTEDLDTGACEKRKPDEQAGRYEALGMVRLLVSELKPDEQEMLRLKYDEELTYGKIGERLGLSVGNVGYRLHHLLKGLGQALKTAGVEGSEG